MFQRGATTWEESKSDPPRGGDTCFLPRERVQSGTPLLTRAIVDKKEKDFSPQRKEISMNIFTKHHHRTHTQDLRLFRCELSKVA